MADPPSDGDDERPSVAKSAGRWAVVIAVAAGLSYGGVRAMDHRRATAAKRVFALDWSRFEGCLLGGATIEDRAIDDAMLALAKGRGDEAWPHACSRPLTRLATAAQALAAESPADRTLEHESTAMESALGEGVFWTRHVQAHRVERPEWAAAFVRLRREVRAWASRNAVALPSPEAPRNPRVARPASEPDDPPPPEPLSGGAEADVVDAIATPTQLSWIFRDRRSRYARCVLPWRDGAEPQPVACSAMTLGPNGDPRDLGFVASDADPMLVVSQRPPSDLRAVLDGQLLESRLEIAGTSRADRDFAAANGQVWGVHRARFSLTLRRSGGVELELPRDADTLWTDRALGHIASDGARVGLVWLRVARGGRAVVRSYAVEARAAGTLALAGDWSSYGRTLERCTSAASTLWLARDGRGAGHVFAWADGQLRLRASLAQGVSRESRFLCDGSRWALVERATDRVRARVFDDATERPAIDAPATAPFDVALAGGALWVADGGGESGALRVRSLPGTTALLARRTYPVLTAPRGVRVVAAGSRVAVLARAEQTHVFVARAGATELVAAALARTQ
ncbi:MAG: hypothetical protein JNK05_25820 [Myxococcales bacterium]|nr:hypothetical protein [Myxococcales bacterium]